MRGEGGMSRSRGRVSQGARGKLVCGQCLKAEGEKFQEAQSRCLNLLSGKGGNIKTDRGL